VSVWVSGRIGGSEAYKAMECVCCGKSGGW
jgi:hypothetical protein